MKNTKKILRKYLEEMAMDFDSEDRPNEDIINKLQSNRTSLSKIPFPKTGNPNQNFQELLASNRYKTLLNKFREITGDMSTFRGAAAVPTLSQHLMSAVQSINRIEANKKRELTQLAVNTALQMFGLEDSNIRIKASITGMEGMSDITLATNRGNPNDAPPEVNLPTPNAETDDETDDESEFQMPNNIDVSSEMRIQNDVEKFNLERAKRRLVNALIQGAGNINQYSSEWLRNRLDQKLYEITGNRFIFNTYLIMMSSNDLAYWHMGDYTVLGHAQSPAGSEQVSKIPPSQQPEEPEASETPQWQIEAKGINFIVLLHELIKGLMEYMSVYEADESFNEVAQEEDTLANETWDLRLGPEIYDRFRKAFTDIIFEYDDVSIEKLQSYFWRNICELPAKEYLVFSREILGNTAQGKEMLKYFFAGLYGHMIDDEDMYNDNLENFDAILSSLTGSSSEDELEDTLNDLFGDIPGIRLLSDYEDSDNDN